jgi:hypothetical protein
VTDETREPYEHTAAEGTRFGVILETRAVEELDHTDIDGPVVERQVELRRAGGEPGAIDRTDLLVDRRHVIDVKTHDMSAWSEARAAREGDEMGAQLERYLDSPDLAGDRADRGAHLLMCGRDAPSPEVEAAFDGAAARHGVESVFVHGEPSRVMDDAMQHIREIVREHRWRDRGGEPGQES